MVHSYNPEALRKNQDRAMRDSKEPLVRLLYEKQHKDRQETAGDKAVRLSGRRPLESASATHAARKQMEIRAITEVREQIAKPEPVITGADYFNNTEIEWLNPIPAKKMERIKAALEEWGTKQVDGSSGLPKFESAADARKRLVSTWNKLVGLAMNDQASPGRRTTSDILTQRGNLERQVLELIDTIPALESQEGVTRAKPQPAKTSWYSISNLKKVAGL
jgi:hypothetical protein